jgi:hypothetical protein
MIDIYEILSRAYLNGTDVSVRGLTRGTTLDPDQGKLRKIPG